MMNLCTPDVFTPSVHFFLIDVAGGQIWNQHTQRGNKECDGSETDSERERDQNPAAGDRNCEGEYCSVPACHNHQSFCYLVDTQLKGKSCKELSKAAEFRNLSVNFPWALQGGLTCFGMFCMMAYFITACRLSRFQSTHKMLQMDRFACKVLKQNQH